MRTVDIYNATLRFPQQFYLMLHLVFVAIFVLFVRLGRRGLVENRLNEQIYIYSIIFHH